MTREQFKEARSKAAYRYMSIAFTESKDEQATKRQKANATRRFNKCADFVSVWDLETFWTADNERAYNTLYKNSDDISAVSAF